MCCNAVWTFNVLLSGQYLCTSDIANSARLLPRRVNTSSKTLPPVSVNVAGPELVITSFRFWSRTFSSRCYTYLLFEYLQFSHECRCHDARFCCVDPELDFRKKNQRSRARRESLMLGWVNSLFVESLDEKKKVNPSGDARILQQTLTLYLYFIRILIQHVPNRCRNIPF